MILKRIGVLSLAKIMGIIYAAMGLIVGFFISFIAFIAMLAGSAFDGSSNSVSGLLFGIGSVFALPLVYGILGAIGGVITAALYNLIAKFTGGLELEFEGEEAAPAQ